MNQQLSTSKTRPLIGLFLASISLMASADWAALGGDAKFTVYLDDELIDSRTPSHPKIWILFDLKEADRIYSKTYRSSKEFIEFDCVEKRYQVLKFILYPDAMGQGGAIDISKAQGFWFSIESSGFIGKAFHRVCAE